MSLVSLVSLLEAALARAVRPAPSADEVPPAALLWTDAGRELEPFVEALLPRVPRLFVLGPWAGGLGTRRGPAIWLRCRVEEPGDLPVLYLPGVRREQLRAVEDQPWALAPLSEFRHRGAFFGRPDGRDWTPASLLLELDPAGALLEAFDDPGGSRVRWSGEEREALFALCRDRFGFDPGGERAEAGAARLLARREGSWAEPWERFIAEPESYGGIVRLMERSEPREHGAGYVESSWPAANRRQEEVLRSDLASLAPLPATQARGLVAGLTAVHRPRVDWVWARLGRSPLACALPHLSRLARATGKGLVGTAAEELAASYARSGGSADASALDALAALPPPGEAAEAAGAAGAAGVAGAAGAVVVGDVIAKFYGDWLERGARQLLDAAGGALPSPAPLDAPVPGECLLFAPGLRMDLGQRLEKELSGGGLSVESGWRWAGRRGAASAAASLVGGPAGEAGERPGPAELHRLLVESGIQVLLDEELGAPKGRAWAEYPFLAAPPDDLRAPLRRCEELVAGLADRVRGLLAAGWRRVRVVTDRGWVAFPPGHAVPGEGATPAEAVVPLLVVSTAAA